MIKFENVGISYRNKEVISKFNLKVKEGDNVLIKGKSGAGKSTLLKLIPGITSPNEGLVYFNSMPVTPNNVWSIREQVAYVSQDTDIGEGKVRRLIDDVFALKSNRDIEYQDKLDFLMKHFHLERDILDKNFEYLSGGEKQRIVTILYLLLQRDVYLLDEITSDLDFELKNKIVDYFLNYENLTLLIVSHDKEWERDNVRTVKIG